MVDVDDEDEQPRPDTSLAPLPEPDDPALFVADEEEQDGGSQLPANLRRKGLWGFLTGRISVKIVVPFIVVMFVLAVGGSYVVLNLVTTSLVQRFQNQLLDAGKNVNDGIIKIEGQQLELLRLMTNTQGVDTAITDGDAPSLQKLLVPLQANSNFSFVDVVDTKGSQVLALRPNDAQFVQALDPSIGSWDVTTKSLSGEGDSFGNKWTELVTTSFGAMVYTGGPVVDDNNQVVGAILVGVPFNDLIKQLTKDVVANVTIYTTDGKVFGTSLEPGPNDQPLDLDPTTLNRVFGPEPQTVQRPVTVGGLGYMELVGGLVVRDKVAGGLGVAVPTNAIDKSGEATKTQMTIMFTVVTLVVLAIGLMQARRISNPIGRLVEACRIVASGDLEHKVEVNTADETGVLAHNFNQMVDGLKERDKIRDTFGRYMTQQVSDAILKGDVKLGGETRELTMLMSDIRSFTTLSETMEPEKLVGFLNRYFSHMVGCVTAHDGVVDKFMGDAILVVYGAPVADPEHPIKAVLTALDMRERLVMFNDELISEGHLPIRIGIGVNTGEAVTGNIGSEAKVEYTVIGDTVNATQRTEDLTKEFKTDILVSETTAAKLDGRFILGEPHRITLRGRTQESLIFPVIGLRSEAAQELWSDHGPQILSDAPTLAQQLADAAFSAAAEGLLEHDAGTNGAAATQEL
ncbi:MAG TPA: adenylate/guanylate cyclase domain-containing protein, partial [Chloroflexota bacterium]